MTIKLLQTTLTTAAAAIFLSPLVVHTVHANELLPEAHYADELNRCVAEIRAELNVADDQPLQHQVTAISREHIWYEFSIETSGGDTAATATCRAWRFDDRTVADIRAIPAGATQLADNSR